MAQIYLQNDSEEIFPPLALVCPSSLVLDCIEYLLSTEDVTWTFSSGAEMRAAEKHGGPSNYGGWSSVSSDQWLNIAGYQSAIGVLEAEAESETGGLAGLGSKFRFTTLGRLKGRKDFSIIDDFFKSNIVKTIPKVRASDGKVIKGKIDMYRTDKIIIPDGLSIKTLKIYKKRALEIRAEYKPSDAKYQEQTNRVELIDKLISERK